MKRRHFRRFRQCALARRNGVRYGYPTCCVDAFIRDLRRGLAPALQGRPFNGLWILCNSCVRRGGFVSYAGWGDFYAGTNKWLGAARVHVIPRSAHE